MKGIKKFFSKKINVVTLFLVLIVITVVLIIGFAFGKDEVFTLNGIYDVFPDEVRKLYSNMVEVSCDGDLHFDIALEDGKVSVKNINSDNLMDYMFSNLDKNEKLDNKIDAVVIKNASEKLFDGGLDFTNLVNNYSYGDYVYTLKDEVITRKKSECISDKQYVSNLYGYSFNVDELSMDVNIGYLSDGVLYDLTDTELGQYDGESVESLSELFRVSPYYRLNYIKEDGNYKLSSVEFKIKY